MKWGDIQGWFDFEHIYDKIAAEIRPDGIAIELGVWKGKSLIYLANKMIEVGKPHVQVIGIDAFKNDEWDGYLRIQQKDREDGEVRSIIEQCQENLIEHCRQVPELVMMDSIEAASLFKDESVDFIFVDDKHTSDHIRLELEVWRPKVRKGRWIAGHDFPGAIYSGVISVFPDACNVKGCWVATVI